MATNEYDSKRENYTLTITRAQRAALVKMIEIADAKKLALNPNLLRALRKNIEGAKLAAILDVDPVALKRSLENVRALAARMQQRTFLSTAKDDENAMHLLRFCREAGVEGSVFRGDEEIFDADG